jgi:hypothetical protein
VLSAQVVSEGKSSFHEYAPMAARFNQQIRRASFPLQPELDQAADGFGAARHVVLPGGPSVDRCNEFVGKAHGASWISARCRTPRTRPLSANFWHCLFHIMVLPYSGLKNKRPAVVVVTPRQA